MAHHYKKNDIKYPSVTTIISDCTDSSGALTQWAANMVVEWIREHGAIISKTLIAVDDPLLEKARFNFRKVSQKALDIGSEVHNAIEIYLKNKLNNKHEHKVELITEESFWAFEAFLQWETEHDLRPIQLEQTVWGSRWAGTLDMVCELNGKIYVVDFKTSKPRNKETGKGIYPEMKYQVAAYRWAMDRKIYNDCEIEAKKTPIPTKHMDKLYKANEIKGCGILRLDKETGIPDWNDTSKTYEQDLRIFNAMVNLYFERHPIIRKRFEGIVPF